MSDRAQMQLIPADGGIPYAVHLDQVISVVGARDTAGELLLTRTVTEPGRGSTFHTHPAREIFYIIDGAFEFKTLHDGEVRRLQAGPGAVVHVPPEVSHQYTNIGEGNGHMLALFTPGEAMEGFFADMDALVHGRREPLQPGTDAYLDASRELGRAYGLRRVTEPVG